MNLTARFLAALLFVGTAVIPTTAASRASTGKCTSCARTFTGRIQRSAETRREFQREYPCPSTGKRSGACPGYVRDHIQPLACGGADSPENIQWQTIAQAKAKDKIERRQ